MVVNIGEHSISIPVGVSNWAKESEDNKFEFDVMLQQLMSATNDVLKKRNNASLNAKLSETRTKLITEGNCSEVLADALMGSIYEEVIDSTSESLIKFFTNPEFQYYAQRLRDLDSLSPDIRDDITKMITKYLKSK